MRKIDKAYISAMLLNAGLLGACDPAAAAVRIQGQVQLAGGRSQVPPLPYGRQARAGLNNWLKQKPALTDDFNFAVQRRLARTWSCIWSRRAAR
jgi:hypothetical protein